MNRGSRAWIGASMATITKVVGTQRSKCRALRQPVTKQIQELKTQLGARLLNRTTRRLSLTEVGTAFYKRAARILEAAEEAKIAAGALQTVPCGRSRINAPVSFGLLHLAPAVTEFLKRFPNWVAISSSRSAV